MEIYELIVHELLEKLEKKEITSQEIVESYLKRIDEKENDEIELKKKDNLNLEVWKDFKKYFPPEWENLKAKGLV